MDQINIVNDKVKCCTRIEVVLVCENPLSVETRISRTVVNEMLYDPMNPDSMLDDIIDDMVEYITEIPHVAECESCAHRAVPLMNMVKYAIRDKSDNAYYVYCIMESRRPYFRLDAENDTVVSTINYKRYQVWVRRFETMLHGDTAQGVLANLAKQLPGVKAKVKYPCGCIHGILVSTHGGDTVMNIVIHLNDEHKWTREAVADWLDSVDDPENGVDLAFKVPEKEEV